MPFKIRTKLIVAFMALISVTLILTGLIGYYNISASDRAVHKVEAIAEEIIVTGELQQSLEHVLMPANDYLITGDRKYIDDFNVLSKRVEEGFKKTDELLGHLEAFGLPHVEEERKTLKDVKTAWLNIKELSLKILSIPNPRGNKDGAMIMEEMDYRWADPATELISKWQKGDVEEYKEAVELAEKARRTSWVIMGSAGNLLLILGAGFAVFYSGFFVGPIKKLHNGADAIAGGDFKSRIDVKTGDELEQLSNAMNEMAEKLDDFYGTLENQVEERTRELKASEERFRVIAETAADAIITMKRPGIVTLWNKSAERMFGFAADEVIGKNMHDIIVPEIYREKLLEGLKSFFVTGTGPIVGKTVEVFALRRDGSQLPVELSVSAMRVNKDEWQTAAIVRDITERKKAEEGRRLNEARLQSLYDISRYQAKNIQDLLDYALEHAIQLTGSKVGYIYHYDEEERQFVLNTWSKDVMKECTIREPQTVYQLDKTGIWGEAVRQRRPIIVNDFQASNALKKGYPEGHVELYKYMTIPVFFDGKRIVAVVGVGNKESDYDETDVRQLTLLMDAVWKITERTRMVADLQESEERYRGIFEKTPNAMVVFDAETLRFENVNSAATELYGYTEEEFLSLTPVDVSAEVEKTRKSIQNGLAEKYTHVPVRYHKKKDGTVFPIEIFMGTFLSKGRPKGFAVIVDLTEMKKNEEMLMESEERYRVLGTTAPNAIICLKSSDTITFWNRRAEEIFGYSEEEAIGKFMHDLIVPERYREKAREGMKKFFQTGTGPVVGKKTELSALRSDGSEFPIELSLSAMNIGGNWQATGIVRDITERKEMEEALRDSEERFRQLFDVGNDAVFVHGMTPEGKPTNFIEVNEVACKRLGYTREELLKMSPLDIDAPEMANQRAAVTEDFLSDKKAVFEMVHVARDGKHIPVEISARLFELKGLKMALSIARDITDRKMAEAAIRQERDRAQMYLDVAGVMFVAIDPDEKVMLINQKGCEVLGYRYDEIIGRNWSNTFIPEISRGDVKGAFTKLISGKDGSVEYFENPVLRKDGNIRIIAWHNAVIRNEAGNIVATLSSGEDITERRKAEDELKRNFDEIKRMNRLMVDREIKMAELKKENQRLRDEAGKTSS